MAGLDAIPKLFDRNFAIGFFLPAGIAVGLLALILRAFGRLPEWLSFADTDGFADAAVVAAVTWLLAVFLVAINRTVVRTLEGYEFKDWSIRGRRLFGALERRWIARFERDARPALDRQREVDTARAEGRDPPATPAGHADELRRAVERFPDEPRHVLPTGFGNRYRAIEVYARVVYGIDAIPAWTRLQAVLPKEFMERVAEAKARLDFCINVILVGGAALAVYAWLAVEARALPGWWLAGVAVLAVVVGYRTACDALGQYGEHVKSAFDLYRGDLAARLGLALPRAADQERAMWTEVSRMMIYRSAAASARLTRFRKPGGTDV